MNSQTDQQLLRAYARQRSDAAFAELVRRHVDLVYSAALRMVRDAHLAEDVTQAVFVALAQNAARLTDRAVLSGWLHRTAQNLAANAVRSEVRRRAREQEAALMNDFGSSHPAASNANADANAAWEQIAPELDAALGALSEPDRDALLLRFFERKSAQEMAQILGVSDVAAQKRVNRAVERLRGHFSKRQLTIGAGGLAVLLSANAVQSAPAGLAASVSTASILAGTVAHASTAVAATQIIAMTTLQKCLITAALALVACAGLYQAHQAAGLKDELRALRERQAPLSAQLQGLKQERDAATSRLAALAAELERSRSNNLELLRLRKEVTQLHEEANNPTLSAAEAWAKRVDLLKQKLAATPKAAIPEMQFLGEDDWLTAAKGSLNSEADYSRAFSALRNMAESTFVGEKLNPALQAFAKDNNDKFPTDLAQLQPYFDAPVDDAILQRWEIVSHDLVPNLGVGDMIITEKAAVDPKLDSRMAVGLNGYGSSMWSDPGVEEIVAVTQAYKAFVAAGGDPGSVQLPGDVEKLLPYATTPEQKAALQRRIDRQAAR